MIDPNLSRIRLLSSITCLFLLIACNTNAQVLKQYKFEYRKLNFIDTLDNSYLGIFDHSFTIQRKIEQDSTYIDSNILCYAETDCKIKYKKKFNGNWYIFFNNKWSFLFDNKTKKLKIVEMTKKAKYIFPLEKKIDSNDTFIPYNSKTINNTTIYSFRVMNISTHESESSSIYWFHPQFGVVAIESSYDCLVREDFSQYLKSTK